MGTITILGAAVSVKTLLRALVLVATIVGSVLSAQAPAKPQPDPTPQVTPHQASLPDAPEPIASVPLREPEPVVTVESYQCQPGTYYYYPSRRGWRWR